MMIGAVPGKTLTDGLPAGTQQAWIFGSPQGVPGASVTISVSTAAPAKTFTVVPWDQEHQQWFDPFACQVSTLGTQADSAFTIGSRFTYVPAAHAWMFTVKVPGPGTVNVSQNGGAKQLIASHRTKVSGGTARVAVGTTTAGRAALAKSGNAEGPAEHRVLAGLGREADDEDDGRHAREVTRASTAPSQLGHR